MKFREDVSGGNIMNMKIDIEEITYEEIFIVYSTLKFNPRVTRGNDRENTIEKKKKKKIRKYIHRTI